LQGSDEVCYEYYSRVGQVLSLVTLERNQFVTGYEVVTFFVNGEITGYDFNSSQERRFRTGYGLRAARLTGYVANRVAPGFLSGLEWRMLPRHSGLKGEKTMTTQLIVS
jgi:hypothetical protein